MRTCADAHFDDEYQVKQNIVYKARFPFPLNVACRYNSIVKMIEIEHFRNISPFERAMLIGVNFC